MVFLNTKMSLDRPFCIYSKSVGITCLRHFCHSMFLYNVTIFALKLLLLNINFYFCHYDTIFTNKFFFLKHNCLCNPYMSTIHLIYATIKS